MSARGAAPRHGRQVEEAAALRLVHGLASSVTPARTSWSSLSSALMRHVRAGEPAGAAAQRLQDGDVLAAAGVVERHLRRRRLQLPRPREHALRQRVTHAVGVGVLHALGHAVRPRVDGLAREGIGVQHEAVAALGEARVVGEHVPREPPELVVEAVEHRVAVDAHLLHDLLVEVVEQLLPGVPLAAGDLGLEVELQLVELELDLLRGAALLVDVGDALLEVHARLHRAQHFVAGAEHAVEQAELLVQELVHAHVGGVLLVEEVDHHHVELLAVAVAPPDALLDALRVPGQVVVDHQIAELQVDALGRGLGGDEDGGVVAEVLDERGAHVGAGRAGDAVGAGVLLQPRLVDALGEPDVEVLEEEGAGLDLIDYIEGRKKVIVVDTVKAGEPPGTMYRFTDKDLSFKKDFLRTAHGIDFSDVVSVSRFMGIKPEEIIFLGVEERAEPQHHMRLSRTLKEYVTVLVNLVMKEIERK